MIDRTKAREILEKAMNGKLSKKEVVVLDFIHHAIKRSARKGWPGIKLTTNSEIRFEVIAFKLRESGFDVDRVFPIDSPNNIELYVRWGDVPTPNIDLRSIADLPGTPAVEQASPSSVAAEEKQVDAPSPMVPVPQINQIDCNEAANRMNRVLHGVLRESETVCLNEISKLIQRRADAGWGWLEISLSKYQGIRASVIEAKLRELGYCSRLQVSWNHRFSIRCNLRVTWNGMKCSDPSPNMHLRSITNLPITPPSGQDSPQFTPAEEKQVDAPSQDHQKDSRHTVDLYEMHKKCLEELMTKPLNAAESALMENAMKAIKVAVYDGRWICRFPVPQTLNANVDSVVRKLRQLGYIVQLSGRLSTLSLYIEW